MPLSSSVHLHLICSRSRWEEINNIDIFLFFIFIFYVLNLSFFIGCYLFFTVNVLFNQVFLKDTDERACAYIAGPAPNRWGFTVDGKDLFESICSISTSNGELL